MACETLVQRRYIVGSLKLWLSKIACLVGCARPGQAHWTQFLATLLHRQRPKHVQQDAKELTGKKFDIYVTK